MNARDAAVKQQRRIAMDMPPSGDSSGGDESPFLDVSMPDVSLFLASIGTADGASPVMSPWVQTDAYEHEWPDRQIVLYPTPVPSRAVPPFDWFPEPQYEEHSPTLHTKRRRVPNGARRMFDSARARRRRRAKENHTKDDTYVPRRDRRPVHDDQKTTARHTYPQAVATLPS